MKEGFGRVIRLIDTYSDEAITTMSNMIPIKAISPMSGGEGELKRAEFLEGILKTWGLRPRRHDYTDSTGTVRPNIVSVFGDSDRTIWFVAHMDTVSEGDRSLWRTEPFIATVKGDRIYGRGAEDNGQGVVTAIYALRALKESGAKPKYNFGLMLVADEEVGSRFGMQKLMKEGIIKQGDLAVVPDYGIEDGSQIEIGEKGMLWLKVTVTGMQAHASEPEKGRNAFRYSAAFVGEVDDLLHRKYAAVDSLFNPSRSTFEMTKHEKNVDSINIIPGTDIFYIDCRVLPQYKLDDIVSDVKSVAASQKFFEVKITIDTFNREDPAPITNADSEIVRLLKDSIKELRNIDAGTVGIGGGTCAAFTRKAGIPTAVWSTHTDCAHQPNESIRIGEIMGDAKVFARLVL
ncbi:MAG: M20 family metallo-hydrolase [Candidatus Marsarchaeota archaeon]|nr:M20 family metallo-hydrolase [Candidatus Marsarchaeota archaeon]